MVYSLLVASIATNINLVSSWGTFVLMVKTINKGRQINGSVILLLLCGAILAFAFSFGSNVAIKGYKSASTSSLIFQMMVLTLLFCLIFLFLESMLPSIRNCALKMRKGHLYRFAAERLRKHPFLIPFCALLVSWMIWIVALYPGAMNWDTWDLGRFSGPCPGAMPHGPSPRDTP